MQLIDWILVAVALLLVLGIGAYTQRFMRSVADFLSAGRVARRYLLAVGRGEMAAGAVVFVGAFEAINHGGLSYYWWSWLPQPIMLVITISGFVIYRYRETRALTLGQFFELRYSKHFRLFAGLLGFFAGLLNFGIIPAIGARVMVYFLDLPTQLFLAGWHLPTYIALMAGFLAINLILTLGGGQITIMVTNCIEGIVSQVLYLVLIFGLISLFSWPDIVRTLGERPTGHSYLNPMDSFQVEDFNVWLVLIGILGSIYGTMAWQNQSSYNSAPLTAHEGVMGSLLGRWRILGQMALITLLGLCAMTYLHDPQYARGAAAVHASLAQIPDAQVQEQMEIPIAISQLLPAGLKGALCVILLLGIFGGDSTHLHSWGSLFIQDVILPLRRTPFSPEQHIRLLRWAIAGVAVFAFFFGITFPLNDYITMWWTVTMGLYIGGAGAVIIGGLYWKKGTTAGAWMGLVTGFVLSLIGIACQVLYGRGFPLNGVEIFFCTMLISVTGYVGVSLLTYREPFNLERMLHRGVYAGENFELTQETSRRKGFPWGRLIGYDENFTTGDKWIAGGLFAWMGFYFLVVVVGSLWNLVQPWSMEVWSAFWYVNAIILPMIVSVITGIWFTWGGVIDMIDLFRRLRVEKQNPRDSGFVPDPSHADKGRGSF